MMTPEEAKKRLRGVVVPLVTSFAEDGSLDAETTASNVQWIVDQGARQGNTIFLAAGSGGDFSALSTEERKQVIKAVAEVSAGRIPIMAGVQSTDIRITIELCQFCEEQGIDAVQIGGAYYYDGKRDDIIAWFEEVARHTSVGFAIYNHWYTASKYDVPVDLVERLLDIPNSIAVKWSSPNVVSYTQGIRRFLTRVAVVNNGPMSVYSHMLGCRAWVSHVPNFFPQHSWMVWELMEQKRYEEAQRLLDAVMDRFGALRAQVTAATAGEGVFVKAAMEAAGLRGGRSRLPSRGEAVTPEIRDGYRRLLEDARALVDGKGVG